MMHFQLPCALCDHDEHHMIDKDGDQTMPCFHRDPTQSDGFCPCRTYVRRSTWEGSDDRD